MNEATIVRKIIAGLKGHLPNAVIDKHNDRISRNIPDLSVDFGGFTTWLEAKYLRDNETSSQRKKHFTTSQLVRNEQRAQQADCRYFVAYQVDRSLFAAVLLPKNVRRMLDDDGPVISYASLAGLFNDVVASLAQALKGRGDVHHSRDNRREEEAYLTGGKKGAVARYRGRYFIAGEISTPRLAGHVARRSAKVKAKK